MYVFAKNFCIRKINQGYTEYIKELYELYKVMLANKIIFKDNLLSQFDYKNIVYLGLRVGDMDWVKNFITKYNEFLDPRTKENAYTYNLASYYYFAKNYDEALTLLRSVEFTDIYYHLDSKSLLLKIYYEQNETEAFFSLVEAFRVYIKRNTLIPAGQKNTYYNMIKFVSKLFKWKLNPRNNLAQLEQEIETTKPLADINWIRKKLEEAKKIEEKLSGSWRKR
jgi:tetratricopeptide (TPR) repeat protein